MSKTASRSEPGKTRGFVLRSVGSVLLISLRS
jgi:hypothetical protein